MRTSIASLILLAAASSASAALPEAKPEALGFDPARLARVEDAVARAIGEKKLPGAVVLVGRRGKIAVARAFGRRSVEPMDEAMTRDTAFDLASLTKPIATATSAMILLERGKFRLGDRVVQHLPELRGGGRDAITIEELLRHRSGLVPDDPISDYADGPDAAWRKIAGLSPEDPPGERFVYSDVGFLVLGRLVERLSGQSLDEFSRASIYDPLGMVATGFRPIGAMPDDPTPLARVAPTERDADGQMIRGVVHDPRSRALGGVAGHAGLFSTADDLAVFAQMLLDGGRGPGGKRVLSPLTVRAMTGPGQTPEGQRRGLGWDVDTAFSGPRGSLFGPTSYGHTGFTGTSLWVDPETETFVILLTSRLHPDGKGASPGALRAEVATLVAAAIVDAPTRLAGRSEPEPAPAPPKPPAYRPVDCGVDVLARRDFRDLAGRRVGLVTNQTGRTKAGVSTIDALSAAPGVRLVALFSPEHGIRGAVDAEVADSKDEKTGLTINSLYGKARKPSAESLSGVDVLVYDIQDVGARFYTYISTLGLVLEAAKEVQIPVVVLDRPNPIGGEGVAGPVRDPDFASFIAHHALPVRHGMTVGELARMFNVERSINADLTVIPCEGWRRSDTFDRTGLEWTSPSPNIRTLAEAILYPGVGLLEASNLATGRGTDTPFERVGAPWIDDRAFARALNELALPGVRFLPVRFTPRERQHAGLECQGVNIALTDWSSFDPVDLGVAMASTLRKLYPTRWEPAGFLRMLADRDAHEALLNGGNLAAIRATWEAELAEFLKVRAKYLIYR